MVPAQGANLFAWGWIHRYGSGRLVGGSGALPLALRRRLEAVGGKVRTSAPIEEILVDSAGTVGGVRLTSGEEIRARAVVAACDPRLTLTKLLPPGTLSPPMAARARHIPTTNGGAACLSVGMALNGQVSLSRYQARRKDGLDLREPILLQGTFEQQCDAAELVQRGVLPDFVPYAATVPTAADPSQAPAGQDTIYIYAAPVPFEPVEPWETLADKAGEALIKDVGTYYSGLEELEIGRWVESWPESARRTGHPYGNPYHVDFTMFRAGPLRPARGFGGYRTPVSGLYLSGAGSHPGAGMSGVPGQLAAREVVRDMAPGSTAKDQARRTVRAVRGRRQRPAGGAS